MARSGIHNRGIRHWIDYAYQLPVIDNEIPEFKE